MTASKFDVTGGLPPEQDLVLSQAPSDPLYREAANIWLFDDQGRFALTRFGVEAVAESWANRGGQGNIAFPDGRVLLARTGGPAVGPFDEVGRPTVIGAGAVKFQCIEPWTHWRMTFDGPATDTSVAAQIGGAVDPSRQVSVRIEADLHMAVPPWIRGVASDEARKRLEATDEGLFIGGVGGFNCKQLFRAEGTFAVNSVEQSFRATGLRVHRQGVRDTGGFRGHCWLSAVFPDGRAFEALAFPATAGGEPGYTEGFVFDGEHVHPAKVIHAPWMRSFVPHGGDCSLTLSSDRGEIRIAGKTHASTVTAAPGAAEPQAPKSGGMFFHQGSALYTWEGQTAYGMIERSLPSDDVAR